MNPVLEELQRPDPKLFEIRTSAEGPSGKLPFTSQMLLNRPSGDLFGMVQNAGMGWEPEACGGRQFLILSTQGGLRDALGKPVALGYHTGHWEISELVAASAGAFRSLGGIPFAGFCSDPCDGRTQGTSGMFDSLPYRNDAAVVFRRLARSLPLRAGVLGVATCDKGLPAMMMALAGLPDLPAVVVPGGVTLPPQSGEDAGTIQTIGARFAHGLVTVEEAGDLGCRACATPGGGCQFLGTAATAQVVCEALGLAIPHSALAPSGQAVWRGLVGQSARALHQLVQHGITTRHLLTPGSFRNAMAVHTAFGGSTNLLLHLPAIAHATGLPRPSVEDWIEMNRRVPRLVSVLPNGPVHHPTVRVFLAGGVPEVMLHLRNLGMLDTAARTCTGTTLAKNLEAWEHSERRRKFRELLTRLDAVDPDDVILPPQKASRMGLGNTLAFLRGNLAPEGAVVKTAAIDSALFDTRGIFEREGPAKLFVCEADAMAAIKSGAIQAGDVMVLAGIGPMGTGMEETYQVTGALKHLPFGKDVTLLTDGRFSGVSAGACIGHISPEALAGGPLGRARDGDLIRIRIDRSEASGTIDFQGASGQRLAADEAASVLARRPSNSRLAPNPALPDDTRLWAALQFASGGVWGGCVYDLESIQTALRPRAQASLVGEVGCLTPRASC